MNPQTCLSGASRCSAFLRLVQGVESGSIIDNCVGIGENRKCKQLIGRGTLMKGKQATLIKLLIEVKFVHRSYMFRLTTRRMSYI
jgi:hypothetical protein